jgi:type VI secretion system secreted protein Hcp
MATSDYFLKVDGINGGSTTEDHDREFIAAGYEFDLSSIMTAATGAGGGSGATKFSPLIVDLFSTAGLADLLAAQARGQHIPTVAFSVSRVVKDKTAVELNRRRQAPRRRSAYP